MNITKHIESLIKEAAKINKQDVNIDMEEVNNLTSQQDVEIDTIIEATTELINEHVNEKAGKLYIKGETDTGKIFTILSNTDNVKEELIQELRSATFEPAGYYTVSNTGGYEVQINECGDGARIKNTATGIISDWYEIEYKDDEETGEMEPFIDPEGHNIPLNQVMKA